MCVELRGIRVCLGVCQASRSLLVLSPPLPSRSCCSVLVTAAVPLFFFLRVSPSPLPLCSQCDLNHYEPSPSSSSTTAVPSSSQYATLAPATAELSLGSPFVFDSALSTFPAQQNTEPIRASRSPSSSKSPWSPSSPLSLVPDVEMMTRPSQTPARDRDGVHADDRYAQYESDPSSAAYEHPHDVSGVGRMGTRKVGGSWSTVRASPVEGAVRPERSVRGGYAHLSAASGPSTSSNINTSPPPTAYSSTSVSSYPPHPESYPSSVDPRPSGVQRSFSTASSAGGWTPQPQPIASTSAYGQRQPHSVPSQTQTHPHPVRSDSYPPQHPTYYSPQAPPNHDPYGPTSSYDYPPPPPPPSSYHAHPLSYSSDPHYQQHLPDHRPAPTPAQSRPTSSSSRPALPSRKSTNDVGTRSGRGSVSSGSTLRKKKSSVAMASSYSHAGVFPASPHPSMPSSRHASPGAQAAHEMAPSLTNQSSSSSSSATLQGSSHPSEQDKPKAVSPKKYHGPVRTQGHVARPPNSWILYRSHTIKLMTEAKEKDVDPPIPAEVWDHPAAANLDRSMRHQSDMSTLISVMWKCESDEVKEKYAKLSQIAKQEVSAHVSSCQQHQQSADELEFDCCVAPSGEPWLQVQAGPKGRRERGHVRSSTRLASQQVPDRPARAESVPCGSPTAPVSEGTKEEGQASQEAVASELGRRGHVWRSAGLDDPVACERYRGSRAARQVRRDEEKHPDRRRSKA